MTPERGCSSSSWPAPTWPGATRPRSGDQLARLAGGVGQFPDDPFLQQAFAGLAAHLALALGDLSGAVSSASAAEAGERDLVIAVEAADLGNDPPAALPRRWGVAVTAQLLAAWRRGDEGGALAVLERALERWPREAASWFRPLRGAAGAARRTAGRAVGRRRAARRGGVGGGPTSTGGRECSATPAAPTRCGWCGRWMGSSTPEPTPCNPARLEALARALGSAASWRSSVTAPCSDGGASRMGQPFAVSSRWGHGARSRGQASAWPMRRWAWWRAGSPARPAWSRSMPAWPAAGCWAGAARWPGFASRWRAGVRSRSPC